MTSDDIHVGIKFDAKVLEKILESGRFKTQFETNKSGGVLSKRERAKLEKHMMSYASKVDPKERPVYGMLFELHDLSKVNLTSPNDCSEIYGDTVAFFKKGIKRYATITGGDSLDNEGYLLASPMLSPSLESIEIRDTVWGQLFGALRLEEKITLSHCAYQEASVGSYVEAQIHGTHATIDQIEHIVFGRNVKEKNIPKELLKKHNITWSREEERDE